MMTFRTIGVVVISFMFMAVFGVNHAQELAPAPAPFPVNDGAAIDQGVAYLLLLVALAITYLGVKLDVRWNENEKVNDVTHT
ncbi:hypothetical protein QVD17_29651 [Tagetes erecta]|uniref:Uncharacterized protein n=1 Tax=Tagetes erecta TaxID=13708 RepID=A0AAD8NLH2_TARER|nr:hypothetical protein QVD17_29651 [Tagetes erecta]